MFNITQQAADAIYVWSSVLLVLGATLALVGTLGAFWSGGLREKFADERISANEAETAKAKAEIAQALLAQERLKALMSWRRITPTQAEQLAVAMKGAPREFWLAWVGDDPEATVFRGDLELHSILRA